MNIFKKLHFLSFIPTSWLAIFFILPLLFIFKISLSQYQFAIPPISNICTLANNIVLTIKINLINFINIITDKYYLVAFSNSIILSVITTSICLIFGFFMAYGICQAKEKTKLILVSLLSISFWTSTLVRIYAWINILGKYGLINSIFGTNINFLGNYYTICLGLVFCYLPYTILTIYSVLDKYDKSYLEAAYDLGCKPANAIFKIILPICKNGVISGGIIVFSSTIGEFIIPELLGSANTLMFGRILWMEFFNNINWPMACALSITAMLFIIAPVYIIQKKYISQY